MTKILNVTSYPVDLDSGRVLAPGEEASANIDHPHNKILLEQGLVLVVPKTTKREDDKS